MKILHILDHSLPLHSGYTFRSQNIFTAQKQMGFDPVALTSPKHEQSMNHSSPASGRETINMITYYRAGTVDGLPIPLINEQRFMKKTSKKILEICLSQKIDIIHAHSPVLNGLPGMKAAKKLRLPFVYEIRAFWEDAAVDHGTYMEDSWKYRLTRRIETHICKKADHVIVLCNGLKNDLRKRGIPGNKMTPVFNGINPEHLKPGIPDPDIAGRYDIENKTVIGFVGSFYRYEGLDLLLKAFALISEKKNDLALLLVGGGEVKSELELLSVELGIQDRVIMPGRIPHEKISDAYALMDILVYPRYSMRLTELVTPLKPLEAMAMKKVLVASDVGGHKELIQNDNTGLLFKAGSIKDLSSTLLKLINKTGLQKNQIEENGYNWVNSHHTWKKTTSVYRKIYGDLMRRCNQVTISSD